MKSSSLSTLSHTAGGPPEERDQRNGLSSDAAVATTATLNLVRRLCQALTEAGITYCHWKSNNALDRSASGENDLDLLVARADREPFDRILNQLGFKLALAPADRQMPGIEDYYGYDARADRIVHVHAHYRLIAGHDMTKNYHLPLEDPYLESAVHDGLFQVPAPEFELVVFVIRMVLKHLTWDTMLIGHGSLSVAERQELSYLQARSDRGRVEAVLLEHLPFISPGLFDRCLAALDPQATFWTRIRVGHGLLRALRGHARRSRIQDVGLKLWRRVSWVIQRRLLRRGSKRQLAAGGALIVVAGGDGAGKSTAINGLHRWLAPDFDVFQLHLGKPTWSLTTRLVRAILSLGRRFGLYPYLSDASLLYDGRPAPRFGLAYYPLLIRELCRSRDRRLAYGRARRLTLNGGLVLCDRFPLPTVAMDGPLIRRLVAPENRNRLVEAMIRIEENNHRSLAWPELVVILNLDPEIAVQRKQDEDADYVRARSQLIWSADWQQLPTQVVDASRPPEEVLAALKALIWAAL